MGKKNTPSAATGKRGTASKSSTVATQQDSSGDPSALSVSDKSSWKPKDLPDDLFARPPAGTGKTASVGVRFKGNARDKLKPIPGPDRRVYRKLVVRRDPGTSGGTGKHEEISAGLSSSEALKTLLGICEAADIPDIDSLTESLGQKPEDQKCLPLQEELANRAGEDSAAEEEEEDNGTADAKDGYCSHNGLDLGAAPLADIYEIFRSIAETGNNCGLLDALKPFAGKKVRIFTMCSGTESPVIAMDLLRMALRRDGGGQLNYQHLGSAEIEPQKQAFIERNFRPPVIFRDVTEFIAYEEDKSHAEENNKPQNEVCRPYTAYGRRANPPEGVHILVAGSSCVDYSLLNSKKKEIEEGESLRTLQGIAAYVKAHRPNIVILENVATAPWGLISRRLWQSIGLDYQGIPVQVNSLNYYLPQTRLRGYCLLINKEHAVNVGLDLEQARREFVYCMARFQRRASSPYTDFMLKEDDFRLQLAKTNPSDFGGRETTQSWTACRKRHLAVRAELQLGMLTPYTRGQKNPPCKLDDHAWQRWALSQTARVLDTLDINQLRYVFQRDYDMRTKFRNFNVSQNIDRDEDRRQWGIVGCITPRGALFHTARGGPLVGLEVFALQGMPIGDLNLSKDSSRDLQDLAGNAMTTTVIGAAILSALIACHKATPQQAGSGPPKSIFQHYTDQFGDDAMNADILTDHLMSEDELISQFEQSPLQSDHKDFSGEDAIPMAELIGAAKASLPICRCEGLGRQASELKICPECFYTTCCSCSREPHHGLSNLSVPSESRYSMRSFIAQLVHSLPPTLALQGLSEYALNNITASVPFPDAKPLLASVFHEPLYFQGVKFDRSWKATYESGHALLQLDFIPVFSHGALTSTSSPITLEGLRIEPTWVLFAKPPITEPSGSGLRRLLRHPLARMRPTEGLMFGTWALWDGAEKSHQVKISGSGTKVPSWEQTLGLHGIPFKGMEVFSELEVRDTAGTSGDDCVLMRRIAGRYKLFQNCPAASGTLHRQVMQSQSHVSPVFFFLDPNPLDDAVRDCFVFATQPPRGNSIDDRTILAKLPAPWRPALLPDSPQNDEVCLELLGRWTESPGLQLAVPGVGRRLRKWHRQDDIDTVLHLPCCNAASTLLLLELPLDVNQQKKFPCGNVIDIELENKPSALDGFGWILSHASSLRYLHEQDDNDGKWHPFSDNQESPCLTCAPQLPSLRWLLKTAGKKDIVKPFEDAEEAAIYEDALKHRPKPAIATMHCHGEKAFLDVKINVSTLIHRAKAQFSSSASPLTQALKSSWRLTRHDPSEPQPAFTSLRLESNLAEVAIDTTKVGDRALWPSQRRTLAWMQKQEQSPPDWNEMALVESSLPALGWRLEAQATIKVEVRGGIIADNVGAGKTTTSLAMVSLDHKQLNSPAPGSFVTKRPVTHINTEATLVLVPKNICKQWEVECNECLKWSKFNPDAAHHVRPYYILIRDVKDLTNLSPSDIASASLILASWDIFEDDKYWSNLRNITCAPDIPSDPGRAFSEWLEMTLRTLEDAKGQAQFWSWWDNIRVGNQNYDRFTGYKTRRSNKAEHVKKSKAAKQDADAPTMHGPALDGPKSSQTAGRKRTLAEFQASDTEDESEPTAPPTDVKADAKPVKSKPSSKQNDVDIDDQADDTLQQEFDKFRAEGNVPTLLHMFAFRRIIVDEFTYIHGKTLLALLKLAGQFRWMLSGTPPIHDYDNVNTIAKLLGTRVSTYDEEEGKFGFGKDGSKMAKDKSDAQQFHFYQNLVSAAYAKTVYDHATQFSAKFIRKSQPDATLPPRHDHTHEFDLRPSEMVTYLEVGQLVDDQDITFSRKPTPARRATAKGKGKAKAEAEEASETDEAEDDQGAAEPPHTRIRAAVEKTSGPDHARMCSAQILAQALMDVPAELVETEERVSKHLAGEYGELVVAKANEILKWLRELWYCATEEAKVEPPSFVNFMHDVKNGTLAERDVLPIVAQVLWYAKANPEAPVGKLNGGKRATMDEELDLAAMERDDVKLEMDLRMDRVHSLVNELAREFCRLRVWRLVVALAEERPLGPCSGCGRAVPDADEVQVSAQCGHIVACRGCGGATSTSKVDEKPCCPGFSAALVLPAGQFVAGGVLGPRTPVGEGSRVAEALSIVEGFVSKGEFGLVFVQHEEVKAAFVRGCGGADVPCIDGFRSTLGAVGKFHAAAAARSKVKKGKGKASSRGCVLVLKTDSVDAAGWNLHEANHVVFLAPLIAAARKDRDATIEQAVGRSRRPRQVREVHVYHLAARGTNEVQMVE